MRKQAATTAKQVPGQGSPPPIIVLSRASAVLVGTRNPHVQNVHSGICVPRALHLPY